MNLLENSEEILTSFLEKLGLAWWIEIITENPQCTYYFGPFVSAKSAQKAQPGYIQDLEQEKARIISTKLKRCQPKELTVCADELEEDAEINTFLAQNGRQSSPNYTARKNSSNSSPRV